MAEDPGGRVGASPSRSRPRRLGSHSARWSRVLPCRLLRLSRSRHARCERRGRAVPGHGGRCDGRGIGAEDHTMWLLSWRPPWLACTERCNACYQPGSATAVTQTPGGRLSQIPTMVVAAPLTARRLWGFAAVRQGRFLAAVAMLACTLVATVAPARANHSVVEHVSQGAIGGNGASSRSSRTTPPPMAAWSSSAPASSWSPPTPTRRSTSTGVAGGTTELVSTGPASTSAEFGVSSSGAPAADKISLLDRASSWSPATPTMRWTRMSGRTV